MIVRKRRAAGIAVATAVVLSGCLLVGYLLRSPAQALLITTTMTRDQQTLDQSIGLAVLDGIKARAFGTEQTVSLDDAAAPPKFVMTFSPDCPPCVRALDWVADNPITRDQTLILSVKPGGAPPNGFKPTNFVVADESARTSRISLATTPALLVLGERGELESYRLGFSPETWQAAATESGG